MPDLEDLQPAADDLGAQLEAEFAARAAATDPGPDPDDTPPPADAPAAPAPPAEPDDEAAAAAGGYTFDLDGQQITLDEEAARRLVRVDAWARSLPTETRDSFERIEAGHAIAVAKAEYDAFQRWQATQRPPAAVGEVDLDELDPDHAEYVRRLLADNEQLRRSQEAQLVAGQRAGIDQLNGTVEAAATEFATRHGLTPDEMIAVQEQTVALRILPSMIEAGRTYSPSGQLLADVDYPTVLSHAFEAGMAADPRLRARLIEAEVAARLTAERAGNEITEGKKARASSLASAPSAAIDREPGAVRLPAGSFDVVGMSAVLRRSMNGGGES